MNQKRLLWIDTAKVIGIFLMILGHRNLLDINSTKVIFSFHMPLFFIISGMFWKNINLDKTIKSISKTLLLPFTIIALIWCVVYVCFYIKNGLPFSNLLPYILGTYISPGKNWGGYFCPLCIYSWFLYALSIIRIVASLCKSKKIMVIVSIVLLCIDLIVVIPFCGNLPLALDSAFLAFPFFTIGHIGAEYFKKCFHVGMEAIIMLISLLLVILFAMMNGTVDINMNKYGNNVLIFILCGIVGSIMIFSLSKIVCKLLGRHTLFEKIISTISNGTILIIGFSASITGIYQNLIYATDGTSNSYGVLVGLLVLATFYPLTIVCQRYFPAIIGFRKK